MILKRVFWNQDCIQSSIIKSAYYLISMLTIKLYETTNCVNAHGRNFIQWLSWSKVNDCGTKSKSSHNPTVIELLGSEWTENLSGAAFSIIYFFNSPFCKKNLSFTPFYLFLSSCVTWIHLCTSDVFFTEHVNYKRWEIMSESAKRKRRGRGGFGSNIRVYVFIFFSISYLLHSR